MSNEILDDDFDGMHWEFVNHNKNVLTNKEAVKFLQISQDELNKIRENRELGFKIHGGMYFYKKADCVNWIRKNQPERLTKKK